MPRPFSASPSLPPSLRLPSRTPDRNRAARVFTPSARSLSSNPSASKIPSETNLFGALWVTQAALPLLRDQGAGHILQVSSIGGISAFPNVGMYHASKWALEGLSQALAQEVTDFGIKVTLIEPGAYSTDWGGASARHAEPLAAYDVFREQAAEQRRSRAASPGDPVATREAVLELVDAADPPLRIFFGEVPLGIATRDYESRLTTWRAWERVSIAAHGGD